MKKRKSKPSGLRKYWPHLTGRQAEAERQKLSDAQSAKCAICARPETSFLRRLSIDHNHKTGRVRGLLCFHCNKFKVGRNTIESSRQIYEYLLKYDVVIGGL